MNIYYEAAIWVGMALLATGLTFGTISALFGYTHHLINRTQYTELVTVVILSAFVPTIIAQRLFQPRQVYTEEERRSAPKISPVSITPEQQRRQVRANPPRPPR